MPGIPYAFEGFASKSSCNLKNNKVEVDNKNNLFTRLIGHFIVSLKMLLLMLKKIPRNSEVLIVTNPALLFLFSSFFIQKKNWKV